MSFWSDPLGSIQGTLSSPKGLGELALLAAVGVATDGFGLAAASGAGAGGAADLAASGAAGATGATTAPVTGWTLGAGAGTALPALGAAGAAAINPWLLGGAGALGGMLLAGTPKNNQPSPPTPTGPLSILHGAGGVHYPTSPTPSSPIQYAAGGGLMQINPNVPMSHNVVPQYATAQNTPMPQPVMNMSSGGNTSADQLPDINVQGAPPYDQYSQYMQDLLGSQYTQNLLGSQQMASGGVARGSSGGLSELGSYSDGGRMLKGPGDGMSDSIPATIAGHQPARLANDEFVVPADVVSHLGNGSSDAGAKKLYDMMDRVRRARTGKPKQAKAIHPERYIPA